MSKRPKQPVHFAAFGYEPGRMKPIRLATGYFLAVTGFYFRLEWLNKAAVISHKDGFKGNYVSGALVDLLKADQRLGDRVNVAKLNFLRNQLNAVVDNDAAVFAAYGDYSTFGNDYTLSSQRFVTGHNRLDGYAGYFLKRVFERTEDGRVVLEFSHSRRTSANTLR